MLISIDGRRPGAVANASGSGKRSYVRLARSWSEVEAAQRLRWRVFAEEMGARIDSIRPGLDCDVFDHHCDHLLAFDTLSGKVIGTYRILLPRSADQLGSLYAEREFDLTPLKPLRARAAELGRSCIDPSWRGSAVLPQLWAALVTYARDQGLSHLIGCASVPMADGGVFAANLFRTMQSSLVSSCLRVQPLNPLDVNRLATDGSVEAPALIRGYLKIGARVCGTPSVDPDFNTADFLMLLDLNEISARFARRFDAASRTDLRLDRAA